MTRLSPSTRVRIGAGPFSTVGFASPDPLHPDTYVVVTPTATGERVDTGFVRDQLVPEPLTVANLTRGEVYAVLREAERTRAATMHRVAWTALGLVREGGSSRTATDGEVQAARATIVAHLVATASRCEGDCGRPGAPTRRYLITLDDIMSDARLCAGCASQVPGTAEAMDGDDEAELAVEFDRAERTVIPQLETERDARDKAKTVGP